MKTLPFYFSSVLALSISLASGTTFGQLELTPQGPGIDPHDFRVTKFAEGLNFPIGMAELPDGSILAAVTNQDSFFSSSSGSLVRLVDGDDDGVAEQQTVVVDDVPSGALSSLTIVEDLVFAMGFGTPIQLFRMGPAVSDPFQHLGAFNITYPARFWKHPHSASTARTEDGRVEFFFQVGSSGNAEATTDTVRFNGMGIVDEILNGDSIYRLTLQNSETGVTALGIEQIASGVRNAAGMSFDTSSGDLYFQDNGIDGLIDGDEPESADELNMISRADIGGDVEDFGFPHTYTKYRSREMVGDTGEAPLVTFHPLPDPLTGSESEGANQIAMAPLDFPDSLSDGVFVTMHGKFAFGGLENEENPLVYYDRTTSNYWHFISNDEPHVGHLDGILSTPDALYLADLSPSGFVGANADHTGIIYQVKYIGRDVDTLDLNADGTVDIKDARLFCGGRAPDDLPTALSESDIPLGDIDLSGDVEFGDFLILSWNFGSPGYYIDGDLNCDGKVQFDDFLALQMNYGTSSSMAPVPESLGQLRWLLAWFSCLLYRATRVRT